MVQLRPVLSVLALLVVGAPVAVPEARQTATGATTITVDFTATANGEALHSLTPADVSLRLDGRPRAITSLRLVHLGAGSIDALPAPFHTNLPTVAARTVIVAVDIRSMRSGREGLFREALRDFAAALAPPDRIALALLPFDGLVLDLTTDHTRFLQQALAITGQAIRSETASDVACRSRLALLSLRHLLEGLTGGVGPTTVVFVSSGLSGPVRDSLNTQFPGQCEVQPLLFQDVADAAIAARTRLYVVEPEDAPATGLSRAGLEHLTGVAQGHLIALSGVGRSGLVLPISDTSTFYLLTFDATADEQNGASHRLDLRPARRGVTLHAHREVFIPKAPANPPIIRRRAADLLTDPRSFRDITLRGSWYLTVNTDSNLVNVVPLAELANPTQAVSSAAIGVFSESGRLIAQWASAPSEVVTLPITTSFDVPVGRYRVRLATASEDGRAGVLDLDVDAIVDGRGPWRISSLVLGVTRDDGFTPKLQFSDEPVAIGMVELYGPVGVPGTVTFELAHSPEGEAVVSVPGTFSRTPDGSRIISTGALPIGGFLDGRWLVRAVVTPEGFPPLRVFRTLEKTVR